MSGNPRSLTADSTIAQWLGHPEGGPLLRELLGQGGFDENALAPVQQLPLQELVNLSQGRLPQDIVDGLVTAVHGGVPVVSDQQDAARARAVPGRFRDQTVIVTGAASGIGRATASRILREGGRVIAVDLSAEKLAALAADAPSAELRTVTADVTDPEDIDRIVTAAGERIDGLANVAGINDDFSPAHEVSDEMWRRVFAVNVDGPLRLIRAVLPSMLAAGAGRIVNVASEAALRGAASGVAYTASKHAVVGITRSCAVMYAPHGIRVNAVAPGGVATGMAVAPDQSKFGGRRLKDFLGMIPPIATADQLAASITFLLSDDGTNINGVVLPSDGGWSAQ